MIPRPTRSSPLSASDAYNGYKKQHKVHAMDTTSAGVMFAGAFLYEVNKGEGFPTAGRFASLAAGKVVANYGPRLPAEDYRALRSEFFG